MLKRDKGDVETRYHRAMLYAELGELKRAAEGLCQVAAARPDTAPGAPLDAAALQYQRYHAEVPKALARVYHRLGQPAKAVAALRAHMSDFPEQVGTL